MGCRTNPDYPLCLYAGLEYTRGTGLVHPDPYPSMIGMVSGFMRLFDAPVIYAGGMAPNSGPWAGVVPREALLYFDQIANPLLPKVGG